MSRNNWVDKLLPGDIISKGESGVTYVFEGRDPEGLYLLSGMPFGYVREIMKTFTLVVKRRQSPGALEDYYWKQAKEGLKHSDCKKMQYSCILVKDGLILSRGYNSSNTAEAHDCVRVGIEHNTGSYVNCPAIHAEQMAMLRQQVGNCIRGAVMYLISSNGLPAQPCPTCANMMRWCGITLAKL